MQPIGIVNLLLLASSTMSLYQPSLCSPTADFSQISNLGLRNVGCDYLAAILSTQDDPRLLPFWIYMAGTTGTMGSFDSFQAIMEIEALNGW